MPNQETQLVMRGNLLIRQFTVEEDGLYAWRRKDLPVAEKDNAWVFGVCKVGVVIDGQYEGCGPIHYSERPPLKFSKELK